MAVVVQDDKLMALVLGAKYLALIKRVLFYPVNHPIVYLQRFFAKSIHLALSLPQAARLPSKVLILIENQ